jgi:hypothetical protein
MPEPTRDECCLPGDITLTQVHTGWMLGRALEQHGPGPWWSVIAIFADRATAVEEGKMIAREAGVRFWFHEGGETYRPIPLDDETR